MQSTNQNELPVIRSGKGASGRLTRREMVQRLLVGAGAEAAWPLVAASHPFYKHLENGTVFEAQDRAPILDWKPDFLNQFQNLTLIALAERIVPGSEKAQVNRTIDLLLSVDTEKNQKEFVAALSAFEVESGRRFGKRFHPLDASQQDEILKDASVRRGEGARVNDETDRPDLFAHFENLKGWVSGAYYSSEKGMRELGWTGDYVYEKFPGCEHPEGHQ